MNITRFAIDRKRITIAGLAVIVIAGALAFSSMSRAEYPSFTVRTALVVTYFPGAAPERVEQLVTDRLEKAIQEIPQLETVRSSSKSGLSVIHVDIDERYRSMRPIWDDLRRKVEREKPYLPGGVIGPFVQDEFGDVFGIVIGVTGEGFTSAELKKIVDSVRNECLLLDEVAKVELYGAQQERIWLEYDDIRLAEVGISPAMFLELLRNQNIITPGGQLEIGPEQVVIEPSGNFESLEAIGDTIIAIPGRADLYHLRDLATVTRGYVEPASSRVTVNGVPALALGISMREGGNALALGRQVETLLAGLQQTYPHGIEFETLQFQPDRVDRKIGDFTGNLVQAVLIVAVVLLLSLGMRTGLIVASLIPLVLLMSMTIMRLAGIGLDMVTLGSMIIALGMLVDNGIVVSESIIVQMAAGKPGREAALDVVGEMWGPLLVSSLITSSAFLPVFLAESMVGEYVGNLFLVMAITLLSSWFLAITAVPFLCANLIQIKTVSTTEEQYDNRFYRGYRLLLQFLLRRPLMSAGGALILFLAALYAFTFVPVSFFPMDDNVYFTAELELPAGSSLAATEAAVARLERYMHDELLAGPERPDGLTNWASFIGQGAPRFVLTYEPEVVTPESALIMLNATRPVLIESLARRIEEFCAAELPDALVAVHPLPMGPPADHPVEIRLSGSDDAKLWELVDQVKGDLAAIPGVTAIDDDWGARAKKILVQVDDTRARLAGLTSQDIAVSLQTGMQGLTLTEYREGDTIIPVVLRSRIEPGQELAQLARINVYSQRTGTSVPLEQVAAIELQWQPAKILRRDRQHTVTVCADVAAGTSAIGVATNMETILDGRVGEWGRGFRYELGGEIENSRDSNRSILAKLPISGIIIVLLLIGQFDSFRKPLIILLTIPLAIIGSVVGLLLTGASFGFMALLGLISLSGVVIYNAVVLLERIKIEQDAGVEIHHAVIAAAQQRLRPIVLTAITTIAGLATLWLNGGPLWISLAITLIFGLAFAALLTLGVIPVYYAIFYRLRYRDFHW